MTQTLARAEQGAVIRRDHNTMISGRVPRPLFQNDHVVGQDDEQRIAGRRFPPTGSRIANPAEVEEKKGTSAAVPLLYARQSGQTISSPLQSPATDPLAAKQNTRVQGYAKHQFFWQYCGSAQIQGNADDSAPKARSPLECELRTQHCARD